MRIAMTAVLHKYFGARVAEGFFHEFSGLLIFAICIPVLFIEMKVLEKLPPVQSESASEHRKAETSSSEINPGQKSKKGLGRKGLLQPAFIVAVVLLGATLGISHTVEFREKIPAKKNLDQFPLKIGEWNADHHKTMARNFIDRLDLSEYVIADYRNQSGKSISFYVAYYESQRKGESIHSPATCLPGSGWSFDQSGTVKITGVPGNNGTYEINRAVMQSGRKRQLSYYWFPQRGRILTNAYQLKIFTFWDALTRQRTDGALVRLITSVYESETLADAEKRLQNFVRDIVPVLEEYIPGKNLS
jgi:exosortase D (VPLPA-CTERM-specific)